MKNLLFLATTLPLVSAFTAPISHGSTPIVGSGSYYSALHPNVNDVSPMSRRYFGVCRHQMASSSSSDGNGEATTTPLPPRTRRTRKDGKQFSPPSSPAETESLNDNNSVETVTQAEPEEEAPAPPSKPKPKENVVVMQVRDIRDIVSGAPESPVEEEEEEEKEEIADEELADDEEWEYYDVDKDGNEIVATATADEQVGGRRGQDDSLEQLLADARSMRASSSVKEEESPVKDKIFEVISYIVTVDFFVVIALFVWFLAGIFCSYVLKDDAVQIAFNMNFEGVTRP